MRVPTIHELPVRNLTTGEPCDPSVAHVHPKTGRLLCECSDGLYYCKIESGLTCTDCHTSYERIEGDMAKTSKKKASKKTSEKLPRAIAKIDLLTGEKVDFKKQKPKADGKPKEPKTSKEVRVIKQTRHLKVELSSAEVDQRGRDAARIRRDIRSTESELKSLTGTFKARIATFEGQLDTALQEVEGRCTYRDVECNEIHDFEEKIVRFVRLDTDVEIERRDMTASELQLPLPKPKPPEADGTEKMACHGKVATGTMKALKESAVERLNEDGDLTASELRARKRKQEALLEAVDEAEKPSSDELELEDFEEDDDSEDESEDGIVDA